jgi:hypothetical protein
MLDRLLHKLEHWPDYLVAFFNACLLFCTATGAQEITVEGVKPRDAGTKELQSRREVRWLSSWVKRD